MVYGAGNRDQASKLFVPQYSSLKDEPVKRKISGAKKKALE